MEKKQVYDGLFPLVDLANTLFYVNGYLQELIDTENSENRIKMQEMKCYPDHMELWYDADQKGVYKGPREGRIPEEVKVFWLYPFGVVDPKGRSAAMDAAFPDWRKEYPVDLPVIKLLGKSYFVDEQRNAFRDTLNCWSQISFAQVCKLDGETGIYLNVNTNQIPFPHDFYDYYPAGGLPDHIEFAVIPHGDLLPALLRFGERNREESAKKQDEQQVGR